ncbi:unnamed protein product [Allacma fusca]|uniref:Uncharacterized protein n=1 Tax=Allacma fusca TaxID=39272 RepID=A0A8J2K0V1_9HEXA|nr:unnamed protein product [Allacma fusca]
MDRWLPGSADSTCESTGNGFASIQLYHTETAFTFLGVAILFALCFLISEIAVRWKYGDRQSEKPEKLLSAISLKQYLDNMETNR